jgi:uncharacterized damage-inducible protein DinB
MKRILFAAIILFLFIPAVWGQKLKLHQQEFELRNVTGSVIEFQGEKVLKLERDLKALPFDESRLEATVDDKHYARLEGFTFQDGTIEVKMYSQLQDPVPNNFKSAQGFIGVYFRIDPEERSFDGLYLRPKVGRSSNQFFRNHTVQYFSYPNFKFDTLRKIAPGRYEGPAPVNIHEWITMRIEVKGSRAEMFINDTHYSTFIVDSLLGKNSKGSIGLYVDIGTIGYFKDLKIVPSVNRIQNLVKDWERAKAYTREYLDAMPASKLGLTPAKEMRSFAGQMLHLTEANYGFASSLAGEKDLPQVGVENGKAKDLSKPALIQATMDSYDYVIRVISRMTEEQLNAPVLLFNQFELTKEEVIRKCFEHQTHHRGQTTVYLRLAGVKVPQEKLF